MFSANQIKELQTEEILKVRYFCKHLPCPFQECMFLKRKKEPILINFILFLENVWGILMFSLFFFLLPVPSHHIVFFIVYSVIANIEMPNMFIML